MKKVYRSQDDRIIFGVCAGIGNYYEVDATLIRIVALLLLFTTGPGIVFFYLILAGIIPVEPLLVRKKKAKK